LNASEGWEVVERRDMRERKGDSLRRSVFGFGEHLRLLMRTAAIMNPGRFKKKWVSLQCPLMIWTGPERYYATS
jgi:hypothetical protein